MHNKEAQEIFQKLDKQYQQVHDNLLSLVVNYDRKDLVLFPADHPKYILRNSIFYRWGSIRFHMELLLQVYGLIMKQYSDIYPKQVDPIQQNNWTNQIMYLYDDIFFNVCSMFDYLGNLLDLLYIGPNNMNIKWNGLIRSCYDKGNRMNKMSISPILLDHHANWINSLFDYRSHLIHKKKESVTSEQSFSFNAKDNEVTLGFDLGLPDELAKLIKKLPSKYSSKKNQDFLHTIAWIVVESLEVLDQIVLKAGEELEPLFEAQVQQEFEEFKAAGKLNNPKWVRGKKSTSSQRKSNYREEHSN